jgi:hypothetical protein
MVEKRKYCHLFGTNGIDSSERIIMWVEFCFGRLKLGLEGEHLAEGLLGLPAYLDAFHNKAGVHPDCPKSLSVRE